MKLHRFEFKYALDPAEALYAKSIVSHLMDIDPMTINGEPYTVTSLYFDTPSLTDYYEKGGGFLLRKKIRARIYQEYADENTPVWIELKKKYDMTFQKDRLKLSHEEWQHLLNRNFIELLSMPRSDKEKGVLEEFIWYLLLESRKPLYFVRYKRLAFVSAHRSSAELRITFDEHIEARQQSDLSEPRFLTFTRPAIIMEVKFSSRLPTWVNAMIKQLQIKRQSFSKYSRSVDALYSYNPIPR